MQPRTVACGLRSRLSPHSRASEKELQPQLDDAGVRGCRDRAEARRGETVVDLTEVRVVEHVEELRAKHRGRAVPDGYPLINHEVDIGQSRVVKGQAR